MLFLWAPGEETRDLLLSKPTPSPQYTDPNPKRVFLALLGLHHKPLVLK